MYLAIFLQEVSPGFRVCGAVTDIDKERLIGAVNGSAVSSHVFITEGDLLTREELGSLASAGAISIAAAREAVSQTRRKPQPV